MLSHVSGTRQEGSKEQRVQCAVGAKQGENKSRDNQQESSPETFQDVQMLNISNRWLITVQSVYTNLDSH